MINIEIPLNIEKIDNLVDIEYHHYYKYNQLYQKVKYPFH